MSECYKGIQEKSCVMCSMQIKIILKYPFVYGKRLVLNTTEHMYWYQRNR